MQTYELLGTTLAASMPMLVAGLVALAACGIANMRSVRRRSAPTAHQPPLQEAR